MSEQQLMVAALQDQMHRACEALRNVMERIPDSAWATAPIPEMTPARVAHHTIETLVSLTSGSRGSEHPWGKRLGAWWQSKAPEQMPARADLLSWLEEAEEIAVRSIGEHVGSLLEPYGDFEFSGDTALAHYVYTMRHVMHHQGQLASAQWLADPASEDSWR